MIGRVVQPASLILFYISRLLLLLLLLLWLQASFLPYATADQGLLPDSSGKLESVVLSVNSARRSTLRNAQLITNIVNVLPIYTEVHIITNDRSAFTVSKNTFPERIHFIEFPETNPLTIWTQDPFLVAKDLGETNYLLKPKAFQRSGDAAMADRIASHTDNPLVRTDLLFEGGNIVSDEKNIFIGANTIRQNAIERGSTDEEIVKRFEHVLGRRVFVVGPYPQPTAHIDMVLTPLGDERLLVADASWGAEILQQMLDTDPETVHRFEKSCEQDFFGSPDVTVVRDDAGSINAPRLTGKTREMIMLSRKMGPILDNIAEAFTYHGYQVHRVPFLFGGPEAVTPDEIKAGQKAAYPMLTYNNVLLESYQGKKYVYMPEYNLEVIDNEAAHSWERLGYSVRTVQGLATSSMYGGSLRCSVKVLSRSLSE